ncbi:MAG: hypothetical protein A3J29_22660 [Acidobacteria bacterium RIFCSPLOWO2_12_FULL_67_14b]|nr:MAG: hypothetical protein A3J29_22660 [Acidobacteria bacterium RIFCSPLOWO2_12_FULL_67_14b]
MFLPCAIAATLPASGLVFSACARGTAVVKASSASAATAVKTSRTRLLESGTMWTLKGLTARIVRPTATKLKVGAACGRQHCLLLSY